MLARSPSKAGLVLVAAVSGRALAQAGGRAGYRVRVADFFGDGDTRAAAEHVVMLPGSLNVGVDGTAVLATLTALAEADGPIEAVVLGSGFERLPDLVDRIAAAFPLAGCGGETIRRVKDPEWLAKACAQIGIPHPEMKHETPRDPENWLAKTEGGAGGSHVGVPRADETNAGRYFQRRIDGESLSVLFIADGKAIRIVGFSRQWTSPSSNAPYRYGGAVRLVDGEITEAVKIGVWLSDLARRAGLVGLCSADFICGEEGPVLIEINPRPGATLDIFDDDAAPLLKAHIAACRGQPFVLPRHADSMASMIAYADSPIPSFPCFDWPDWTADRQDARTQLCAGDPICTVLARAATAEAARCSVEANLTKLQRNWLGGEP